LTELLSVEHAWSRLTTHLEWADRFWVLFIFTDDPRVSDTLCRRAGEQLDAVDTSFAVLRAGKPDEIDELTRELLEETVVTVTWVDLVRHDGASGVPGWAKAWERLMLQLNERRELLRRRSPTGGIVFATTLDRLDETPALAPDLWTIRALLLRVATLPSKGDRMPRRPIERWASVKKRLETRDPQLAHQALARARGRALGDERGLLATLLDLAEAETGDASLEAAREAHELIQKLEKQAEVERRSELITTLRRLGDLFRLDEYDAEAEACYRRGIELGERTRELQARVGIAKSLLGLGRVLGHMAQYSRLRSAELRTEALQLTQRAVEIHRELAHDRGDEFKAELEESLGHLADRLHEIGKLEQALKASEEAANIMRALAARQPDDYQPEFARSLRIYGRYLSELGRRHEAVERTQEALALYRDLVTEDSDRFSSDLAKCLGNLGLHLYESGHWEEALSASQEALELFRGATSGEPTKLMHHTAKALINVGLGLDGVGRHEEALESTRESVEILRNLAQERPDEFNADLARSLTNLASRQAAVGQREEAIQTTRESIEPHQDSAIAPQPPIDPQVSDHDHALARKNTERPLPYALHAALLVAAIALALALLSLYE